MQMCKTQNNFNLNVKTKFSFILICSPEEDSLCDFFFNCHFLIFLSIFMYVYMWHKKYEYPAI